MFTLGAGALTMSSKHFAASLDEKCRSIPGCSAEQLTTEWVMRRLMRIIRCELGGTAIEYALVGALISIAALAAMQGLGNKIGTMYTNVGNHLN